MTHHILFSANLLLTSLLAFSQQLPIHPTRTISFTTDEGSWMNVDVSPDGKTLLFDLLGDLYTVPSTGGTATQITRGMAINLRPVWSPDGTRIAYISDYSGSLHLNVRDLSGKWHVVLGQSDAQVNYNLSPLWTSDGNHITLERKIYSLTGGETVAQNTIENALLFANNGRLIYYLDSGKIFRYDRDDDTKTVISSLKLKQFQHGTLSSDAHWWVYVADSNSRKCLVALDLHSNREYLLVPSLQVRYPNYKAGPIGPSFSFSPDSKYLFTSYGGKIHRIELATGTDQVIPFEAHVRSDAGPFDYNTFRVTQDSIHVRYCRSASTSPDGKQLVFMALNRIYITDLPHGKARVLSPQPINQFQPTWSPDGKWIAYVSWCDTAGGQLWRVPASGGQPEQLTDTPAQYQRPAWSPDGKLIAIIKGPPQLGDRDITETGRLQLIPVDGGEPRIVDDTVPLWNQVTFSPNGDKIMYSPKAVLYMRNSGPLLVSRNVSGNDMKILAVGYTSGNSTFIAQRSISPDSRFAVYSMGEDLYLVPVSKTTEPTILYDEKQKVAAIRFATGVDPIWEHRGKMLGWTYGNRFFRIEPDKILAAALRRKMLGSNDSAIVDVSVSPDQVLPLNVTAPSFHAHGAIALTHVRIITMQGAKVIDHGTIIIKDGRILAVSPIDSISIPEGSKVLDLSGSIVMPGFVDLHLHMRVPPDVFPQQSWMYLANLAFGVTTARDPSSNFDAFGYSELLESGQMIGPRLYTVGRAVRLSVEGIPKVDNFNDAMAIVRKREQLGGTIVKQYLLPARLQREWLLMASHQAGLNMTNEGAFLPIESLAMMKDGSSGVEHNPDWGDMYKDVALFIARIGTYFTPTLQVRYGEELARSNANYTYWRQPNLKLTRFWPKKNLTEISQIKWTDTAASGFLNPANIDAFIWRQGGKVALGSHGNNEGIGVHNQLWALQAGGLSNMEALQAATIVGARALGMQRDIGSIEPGKIADLLVLNKNPLEDIHNSRKIRYVIKDGILYDANTLDILWPSQKKCPEWRLKVSNK